ncbi:tRNA(His) guanylyltransferase [Cryptococcus deuterogattii LA55]|nr:tRNA(His) guanylyltransferase [Cryptococcus deuterogattii LA55]KIR92160.1 tRNA(His) guanylyltransferase [Cryptococcus deuterogattii CBS 10090]
MAKSRFEYVKKFELPDPLMPNTYIIVRIDGKGFHKFSDVHSFDKPNDVRALDLMDTAAKTVLNEYKDVVMAFGESDEYSFLLRRTTTLYNRRRSKINSSIVSLFTSAYVFHWTRFFPNTPLLYPPSFDGRVILYPNIEEVRDYFSWRQADTHINNLYNTTFWALVHGGLTTAEANKTLQGTNSKDKNEILFTKFGINYNTLPEMFRKGSVCVRSLSVEEPQKSFPEQQAAHGIMTLSIGPSSSGNSNTVLSRKEKVYQGTEGSPMVLHVDIIKDLFWSERPWLLS